MTRVLADPAPAPSMRETNPVIVRRLLDVMPLSRKLLVVLLVVPAAMSMYCLSMGATLAIGAPARLEIVDFSARALNEAGEDDTVAGGHPFEATTSFSLPAGVDDPVKSIVTELPAGFAANVAVTARCRIEQLRPPSDPEHPVCPAASQVGTVELEVVNTTTVNLPVYNLVPERGYPAQIGFNYLAKAVVLYPRLRPRTGAYGVTVSSPGIAILAFITAAKVSLYDVPSQRNGTGGAAIPFVSNPADCLQGHPSTRLLVDSWAFPGRLLEDGAADFGSPDVTDPAWRSAVAGAPPVTGCDAPPLASQFVPSLEAGPSPGTGSSQADAPSGFTVDLSFGQSNDPTDSSSTFDPAVPSAPPLKDAVVSLPEGVAISPSAADGLDGCSDLPGAGDQVHYETTAPVRCPEASRVGSVIATSPLLAERDAQTDEVIGAEPIGGDVYILKPHPGDLSPAGDQDGTFRLLIQVNSPEFGVNAKLPGIVTADRATGRLTARFEDNPQLPVKHLRLVFNPGSRAALVNPPGCTTATTSGVFTPWSRGGVRSDGVVVPGTPNATSGSDYPVSWDGQGGSCPARLPFGPVVSAGLVDSQAGGSSPFTFDLTREDRNDVINGINVGLPGGLLAAVKNVALCSDADANAGSCPAASRVGVATVAAGSGSNPFYLSDQPVSLTGPYKGAPYGLAIAVHAVAGPFDLGTVVVRQALQVDPDELRATVVSDPLPTIRDGVPLRVRRIHVEVDRPGFMRSPTSCQPKTITANVLSAGGQTATLATPLQASGCAKLPFSPKLAMKLTGASQAKVGGHPGVEAMVTQRPGEAGIKAVTVTLPLSLALDPDNAQSDSLCEYADGLRDQCPQKSVIGTVTAVSPLLKTPLNGKVYFVKGVRTDPKSGRQIKTLPTLLIELRGEVDANIRATNSVPDNRHLTSTFPMIPDAPISSFSLKLNGGKKGILVITDGHADICSTPQKPFLSAVGHNGRRLDTATSLAVECPLAVVSRTFTPSSVKVKVSGIGAGTVTVSGSGLKTTRRTVGSSTSATVVAKLTAKGKRMRKAKQDVRVKASFVAKGVKKATIAYSPKAKAVVKK
jgi:hypothetical protein